MIEKLTSVLPRWLFALGVGCCTLSMTEWLGKVPLHLAALCALLAVWTAALAAADRKWGTKGVSILIGLTILLPLLLWDHEAIWSALPVLFGGKAALSATTDLLIILPAALVTAAAYDLLRLFEARYLLSLIWIAFWITAALMTLAVPRAAIGAMLPLLLFTLAETVHILLRRRGRFDTIAPVLAALLAVSVLVGALPVSAEPYPYPILHALAERVDKLFEQAETYLFYRSSGSGEYSLGFNGFSEEAETGDRAETADGQSITVEIVDDPAGAVYLAGNSWDTYRDGSWYETVDGIAGGLLDWNIDTAEHLCALWRWESSRGDAETAAAYRENGLIVRYDGLETRTLFTPPDALRINTNSGKHPYTAHAGRVLFDYVQKRDAVYAIGYLEPQGRWEELVRASESDVYDGDSRLLWETVNRDLSPEVVFELDGSTPVEELLWLRERLIRRTYLGVPEDTSEEVRALAAQITAPCRTDYEKLTAIADYLRQNYRYTAAPQPVPEGTSLLDHLLFGVREGYCTWFATAAAVLARASGVPARYVQGYRAALRADERVQLTGENAHAWCEGYVSGFGWVIVEATPGYSAPGGQGPGGTGVPDELPLTRPPKHNHAVIETPVEENEELPAGQILPPEPELPDEPDDGPGGDGEPAAPQEPEEEEPQSRRVGAPFAAACVLLALAAAAIAALRAKRERERRAYESASYAERAVIDLRRLLGYLARRGYRRAENRSIAQHFAGVRWKNLSVDETLAVRMARLYEEVLFGGRELGREEWEEEKRFTELLAPDRFDLRRFLRRLLRR